VEDREKKMMGTLIEWESLLMVIVIVISGVLRMGKGEIMIMIKIKREGRAANDSASPSGASEERVG
jgi:hypothetical protein